MKNLILNFSWDRLVSLPPTEFLAVLALIAIPIFAIYKLVDLFNN